MSYGHWSVSGHRSEIKSYTFFEVINIKIPSSKIGDFPNIKHLLSIRREVMKNLPCIRFLSCHFKCKSPSCKLYLKLSKRKKFNEKWGPEILRIISYSINSSGYFLPIFLRKCKNDHNSVKKETIYISKNYLPRDWCINIRTGPKIVYQ